ncbi:protein-L-isoaspartate O-methyltransferase [Actinosynnema sp. ALI-1.44]|uniref:methyltransferase domain-containing protein n=1 Tax=Actinosynnema sp. ALI-1.44 TaxID=1933779 RepID=UPI00097C301B|nr:methyltransferase domain-containing protein [Actinosynnema sp. ALI-1.44]ONI73177.1 protein-L-isoaspartate O-methyltransferase [Actinosynnema sp. ALI-1.44]
MSVKAGVEGTAARLRSRLVRALVRNGTLTDPAWRDAFLAVPRHAFLPRYFRQRSGRWEAVDTGDEDWLAQIYADRVLVTQLDGDSGKWQAARDGGPVVGAPTCSSSMPTIMAVMLEALQVKDDHRILEVGTGTGYNAALLCVRVGDRLVSTIDIDESLAGPAERHLADCGLRPTCVVADGVDGLPQAELYDRVLCTCAVPRIPVAWLEQTRPGGLVVTTLSRPLGAGLVRITAGEGGTGTGEVLADDGRFMPLRAPRTRSITWPEPDAPGSTRPTTLASSVISPTSPFEFFAGLELPDVHAAGAANYAVLTHPDGSWARHESDVVVQAGPRRLWDEMEVAYDRWQRLGQPRRARFGVTIDGEDQRLWLDAPTGPNRWPLA